MSAARLIWALAALALVPLAAAAQAMTSAPPVLEALSLHPACDRPGEQAVSARFEDLPLTIDYPPMEGAVREGRGFSRQAGQSGGIRFQSPSGARPARSPDYPRDVSLDARLVLCVTPDTVRVADAEWLMLGENEIAKFTSSRKPGRGAADVEVRRLRLGRTTMEVVLTDRFARLREHATRRGYKLEIRVGFRFPVDSLEVMQ